MQPRSMIIQIKGAEVDAMLKKKERSSDVQMDVPSDLRLLKYEQGCPTEDRQLSTN